MWAEVSEWMILFWCYITSWGCCRCFWFRLVTVNEVLIWIEANLNLLLVFLGLAMKFMPKMCLANEKDAEIMQQRNATAFDLVGSRAKNLSCAPLHKQTYEHWKYSIWYASWMRFAVLLMISGWYFLAKWALHIIFTIINIIYSFLTHNFVLYFI